MDKPPYDLPLPALIPVEQAAPVALAMAGHLMALERTGTLKICKSVADIRTAMAEGKIAAIMHMEGAEAIGLHESTVSRATANKSVMLPWRQVVPFRHFFKASLSVRDVLREIIVSEDKPLTDAELVKRLADKGYHIARRTVAKYRDQLRILPSSLR